MTGKTVTETERQNAIDNGAPASNFEPQIAATTQPTKDRNFQTSEELAAAFMADKASGAISGQSGCPEQFRFDGASGTVKITKLSRQFKKATEKFTYRFRGRTDDGQPVSGILDANNPPTRFPSIGDGFAFAVRQWEDNDGNAQYTVYLTEPAA